MYRDCYTRLSKDIKSLLLLDTMVYVLEDFKLMLNVLQDEQIFTDSKLDDIPSGKYDYALDGTRICEHITWSEEMIDIINKEIIPTYRHNEENQEVSNS